MQNNVYSSSAYPPGIMGSSTGSIGHWSNITNFTTPGSEAMYVTTSTSTWAHTVPPFMPWIPDGTTTSCTTTSNSIVRFSAPFPPDPCTSQTATSWELLHNTGASRTNANMHLKRRSYSDEIELTPRKQTFTDEKMAARMQNLRISNAFVVPENGAAFNVYNSCETDEIKKNMNSMEQLKAMLSSSSSNKSDGYKGSLVLAPEIKNLIEPEKLFAKTFINQVERPTMAVVLWEPPHGSVQKIINTHLANLESVNGDSQNNFVSSSSIESSSSSNNSLPHTLSMQIPNIPLEYNPADISLPDENDDFDMEA